MSKKKKPDLDDVLQTMFGENSEEPKNWTKKDLEKIFNIKDREKMTEEDRMILIASAIFIQNGITPEVYTTLYSLAEQNPVVNFLPVSLLFNAARSKNSEEEVDDWDDEDYERERLTGFPLKDADKKSLVLKIQLRGISKPPLWREVRIPADYNFQDLHEVIQCLFGWTNSHMWQFEEKPYSHGYTIAPVLPDTPDWDDAPTNVADETPVTMALKSKGDKMVYVYDFGDDWVHDISVKEVLDGKTDYPVCLKYKSDNPIEDVGGSWGLEEYRDMNDPKKKHTKAEMKEFLDNSWFDTETDFRQFMKEHEFNIDFVNDELKNL